MNTLSPLNHTAVAAALALTLAGCGKTPEQHFENAQQLVQKRDYRATVIELKSVLQEQPDNRDARQLLGEVFFRSTAYPDAEKELSRARSLGAPDEQILPTLAEVYVRMGEPQKALDLGIPEAGLSPQALAKLLTVRTEALLQLGKKEEAEQTIEKAKQVDPNQPYLLLTQSKLALINRQKDRAEQLVDDALRQDPTYAEALYLKAAFLGAENKPDDAAKVYQQILANDAAQFRAHLAVANLHLNKGDIDAADKAIRAAETVAGKTPIVMYTRGILELQRGNLDKANSTLQEVLKAAPNHLPSMLAYATANYRLGNYQQSISYAGKVLGAAPYNLIAGKVLANSQLKTGDAQGALKTLDSLLAKHPNDAGLLAMAGDAHLRIGDYTKAMGYLDRAAEIEPENPTIRTRLAAGHLASGDGKDALADLEAAARLSDKAGQADTALVLLHLKGKDYDKALQAIANLEKKLPNNPVTHNLRAAALLGKGDRANARKALEQALAIQPTFLPAALNLARLDVQDKKPQAARKRFDSILAADKNNAQAMLALADLAAADKKEKDYVAWLEKAVKADPQLLAAHLGLVRFYLSKKQDAKALAHAREAADANPDKPGALELLGATQMAAGDRAGSLATYTTLAQKSPRSAGAQMLLANAQVANKQAEAARRTLKNALQLKPDFLKAQEALIQMELADGKLDAALQIARQIQAQQPKSPVGFEREADILLSQKRYPQAIRAYEQALAKGPGPAGLIKLHRALFLAGDTRAADQRLASWMKQHPEDPVVQIYAAEVYTLTQRNREAIALYEVILKRNPNNPATLNNLAILYQREKDSRALTTAERALKLAPESPAVQDTLGWVLVQQGQLPRGLDLLRKAAAKAPYATGIRYHYGAALARSGRKSEAKRELKAALASGQNFPELSEAKALLDSL